MLFVRPGEPRRAEWSEIDLDAAEWRIPATKTKTKSRVMHIFPLATQAVNIPARVAAADRPQRLGLPGRANDVWGMTDP